MKCARCGEPNSQKLCSHCNVVPYCGQRCADHHWFKHVGEHVTLETEPFDQQRNFYGSLMGTHNGIRYVQFIRGEDNITSFMFAKKSIIEYISSGKGCGDNLYPSYVLETLSDPNMTYIFMAQMSVPDYNLSLGKVIPVAFVLCIDTPKKTIKIDLALICARPGFGVLLLNYVLHYFANKKKDVYLNALTGELISYYGKHGFVTAKKGSGCSYATPDFVKEFDRRVADLQITSKSNMSDDEINQAFFKRTKLRSEECYQSRMNPNWKSGMPNDERLHNLGYYMIFCPSIAGRMQKSDEFAVRINQKPTTYPTTIELDTDLRNEYFTQYNKIIIDKNLDEENMIEITQKKRRT